LTLPSKRAANIRQLLSLPFHPEDGGSRFFRNADYLSTRLNEVTFQRIVLLILTAVGISDLHTLLYQRGR